MNGTETYLVHVKSNFWRYTAQRFIIYIAFVAVSFALAYPATAVFCKGRIFTVVEPMSIEGAPGVIGGVVTSQIPTALVLMILFASTFTVISKWIGGLLCVWRGACLGVSVSLMGKGVVGGITDEWTWSLALYFTVTVAFAALSAVSAVYSDVICRMHGNGERKYAVSVTAEYIKLFLVMSGGIFILGGISVIII